MLDHHPAGRWGSIAGLLLFLLALIAIPFAVGMRIDNNLERWIDPSNDVATRYAAFLETFGSDEFILVAYAGGDPFGIEALDAQLATLEAIEAIDGVVDVLGIPAVYRDIFGGEDADALRDEFASSPFYDNFLFNAASNTAGLVIELQRVQSPTFRQNTVDAVRAAVSTLKAAGWEIHLAGSPVLGVVVDERSQEESQRTFPLAILCSSIVMVLLFRSVRALIVALLCGGLAILMTVGLMGACGYPLTMVTAVLPCLLWVLALAGIIHLLRAYQRHAAATDDAAAAVTMAFQDVAAPCMLASITTALGFLSLRLAGMEPVQELGTFAAAGLVIALAVNLLLGPILIRALRVPGLARPPASGHHTRMAALPLRMPRLVVFLALLLIVPGLWSLRHVRVEVDPLAFLRDTSPTVQDYEFVASRLSGYHTMEVVIDTPEGWLKEDAWPTLDQLGARIATLPGVARVLSPLDLLRKLHQWDGDLSAEAYRLPDSSAEAERLVAEMDPSMKGQLGRLVAADEKQIRLSVLVNVMNSQRFAVIADGTDTALGALPPGYSSYTTGILPQLISAQLKLVDSQVRSFGLAFAAILFCLAIGLRSIGLLLVSIPANLLPILAAFATMATFDIALDAATIMMASVALGIAVDDTAHYLSAYRRLRLRGESPRGACEHALATVGPAMTITTLTACIGFFALQLSAFLPIAWFGLLSGVAIAVALLADYLLVPALLLAFRGKADA